MEESETQDFSQVKREQNMSAFMTKLRAKMMTNIKDLPLKEKYVEKKKCI